MSGHSINILDKGYLVLFGGYSNNRCRSNIYISDLEDISDTIDINLKYKNFIFHEVFVKDNQLPELASSAMCSHPYKNIVYIFGGSGSIWGRTNSDHFIIVDFDSNTKSIKNITSGPPPMYGATLNYYNEKIYLYGGTNGTVFFNSLYEYDLNLEKWNLITTAGKIPEPKYKHSSVLIDEHLYIIGGGQYQPDDCDIKIHKLNLKTLMWSECKIYGDIPKESIANTSTYDPISKKIWIFGGRLYYDEKSNYLYSYDIETLNCTKHSTIINYNIDNSKLTINNIPIDKREFHAMTIYKNKLFIVAGSTGLKRLNTVLVFHLPNFL